MKQNEFDQVYNELRKALKTYDGIDLVETRKLTLGHPIDIPSKLDMSKMTGGCGKLGFGIPAGEWSLIKALQEGK